MTPQGTVTLTADQRRRLVTANPGEEEKVRVTFTVEASILAEYDVVVTTYDVLERKSVLFGKVSSCYYNV